MDYRIHRPDCRCGSTGKPLAPGERFYSSLVRREGKIERLDIATDAWAGPPIGSLAWWRSTMPAAEATATLAPAEVLLDVLEQLADSAADEERSLRYLLALVLVRRRVLRIIDEDLAPSGDSPALLGLHCRRRSCDYRVAIAPPPAATAAAVQQRLLDLLWSLMAHTPHPPAGPPVPLKAAALAAVLVAVAASGASCPQYLRGYQYRTLPLPRALPAQPTLGQIIEAVHDNTRRVRTYMAPQATLAVPGVPKLSAQIACEPPRRFRLRAQTSVTGNELDLGSNDELFWLWVRRHEPPVLLFCR